MACGSGRGVPRVVAVVGVAVDDFFGSPQIHGTGFDAMQLVSW